MSKRPGDELEKDGDRPLNIGCVDEGFGPDDQPPPSPMLDDDWPGTPDPQGPPDPPDCLD